MEAKSKVALFFLRYALIHFLSNGKSLLSYFCHLDALSANKDISIVS